MATQRNSTCKITLVVLICVSGLVACGGDDDDDDTTYHYDVTSTTFFTGGEQVAVLRLGIAESCSSMTDVTSAITRVGAGTVSTPGAVAFSFTTAITPPMLESVYIDNNASGHLDAGDRVWGDNPDDFAGVCFDSFDTTQVFDWEVVAAQIQAALGLLQPSIIYTGAPQSYRGEPGMESGSMIEYTMIVDGEGYDGIRW